MNIYFRVILFGIFILFSNISNSFGNDLMCCTGIDKALNTLLIVTTLLLVLFFILLFFAIFSKNKRMFYLHLAINMFFIVMANLYLQVIPKNLLMLLPALSSVVLGACYFYKIKRKLCIDITSYVLVLFICCIGEYFKTDFWVLFLLFVMLFAFLLKYNKKFIISILITVLLLFVVVLLSYIFSFLWY